MKGTVRTTVISPNGNGEAAQDDFGPGDVWFFPKGHGHMVTPFKALVPMKLILSSALMMDILVSLEPFPLRHLAFAQLDADAQRRTRKKFVKI